MQYILRYRRLPNIDFRVLFFLTISAFDKKRKRKRDTLRSNVSVPRCRIDTYGAMSPLTNSPLLCRWLKTKRVSLDKPQCSGRSGQIDRTVDNYNESYKTGQTGIARRIQYISTVLCLALSLFQSFSTCLSGRFDLCARVFTLQIMSSLVNRAIAANK